MNIKLKSEVLEKSIQIESYLSQILMRLLDIENLNNRSFGTKGSALSFRSKADLLYDINKIQKELYTDLILFMEIRNQFIHNYDTNSFEKVNSRLSKKNRLVELYEEIIEPKNENWNIEKKLKKGFICLCIRIVEKLQLTENGIIKEKEDSLRIQIEIAEKNHELEFKEITNKALADSIDDAMDLLNKSFSTSDFGRKLNSENILTKKIKSSIFSFLEKNMRKEIDNWSKKTRAKSVKHQ